VFSNIRALPVIATLAALGTTTSLAVAENSAVSVYHSSIVPILEDHCFECHGDGYDKGKVAFDALESDQQILKPELWLKVLLNTRAGLMPAERKPRLSPANGWVCSTPFRCTTPTTPMCLALEPAMSFARQWRASRRRFRSR